jgi:hypothetical protein
MDLTAEEKYKRGRFFAVSLFCEQRKLRIYIDFLLWWFHHSSNEMLAKFKPCQDQNKEHIMKMTLLLLSTIFLATSVYASEPLANPDALEGELTACLLKNKKTSNCMETIIGKRILPGNDQLVPIAKQMDELLQKWLAGKSVYAIHPIRTNKAGDIYEKRIYMIEDTSGALMVFDVATLKRLGKWYVIQFNLSSTSNEVMSALKGEEE